MKSCPAVLHRICFPIFSAWCHLYKSLATTLPALSVVEPPSVREMCVPHVELFALPDSYKKCCSQLCECGRHCPSARFVERRWPTICREVLPCCTPSSNHRPYCTARSWGTEGAQHTFSFLLFFYWKGWALPLQWTSTMPLQQNLTVVSLLRGICYSCRFFFLFTVL